MSATRITVSANHPPGPGRPDRKPTTTPSTEPMTNEIAVPDIAMSRSIRGAYRTRERMSVPLVSVPNQCVALGGSNPCAALGAVAEYGTISGASGISRTSTTEMTIPAIAVGCLPR